jgi:predicted Ser/Thr protein kinase
MKVQDRTPERLGPYRLVRRIGEGGMGVVYLALNAADEQVAVKALHPVLAQEANARRRMGREVETMRRVRSRYVAEVLDADLDGDPPYIVTRYVPGLTLDDVVAGAGPLSGPALARLAYGLAEALAAVHSAGVVHRDLKPGNVMISDGEPVIIDFGIAHLHETTRLTMTGMFMGTPGYLAPEVIEGNESGAASDVHSWGATVAFAATGRPPYGTGPFETIFYRIMHGAPNLDTLPAPLRPIVLDALARDPARRPSPAEICQRIATIDPAALVPSPPDLAARQARGGQAAGDTRIDDLAGVGLGGVDGGPASPHPPAEGTDQDWAAWPATTRPLTTSQPDDVRDLLPPVSGVAGNPWPAAGGGLAGGSAGAGLPGADLVHPGAGSGLAGTGQAGVAAPGQAANPEVPPPGGLLPVASPASAGKAARTVGPVSPWSPLVIATVAMVVAVSVMAPIIGTGIALALLVALRAVTITGRQLARRQSGDGSRAGLSLLATVLYPLAALRALFGLVLAAPVALLAFCVVAAITIIAVRVHPLPQAVALGAGAFVAVIGLGPGSSGSRTALARIYTSAARSTILLAIAYVGVTGVVSWAGITAFYQSPAPAYWPVNGLHQQLLNFPAIKTMLTDVRQSLLRLAHQVGL